MSKPSGTIGQSDLRREPPQVLRSPAWWTDAPGAANDGRVASLLLIRDRESEGVTGGGRQGLRDTLARVMTLTVPEIRLEIAEAPWSLRDPLAAGRAGPRDFRVAAAGCTMAGRSDVVAVEALSVPEATVVRLRAARAPGAFAGPLAPPLEGLCSLHRPLRAADAPLLALALVAHLLAETAEADIDKDPGACRIVRRLAAAVAACDLAADPIRGSEVAALTAWSKAWCGLATGDHQVLDIAHRELAMLVRHPAADFTRRETAQLLINRAVVCLALGGSSEGLHRLGDGLDAARTALPLVSADLEPSTVAQLAVLIRELEVGVGRRRRTGYHPDRRMAPRRGPAKPPVAGVNEAAVET